MKKLLIVACSIVLLCHARLILAAQNIDELSINEAYIQYKVAIPDADIRNDKITVEKGIQQLFWDEENLKAEGPVKNRMKDGEWKIYYAGTQGKIIKARGSYTQNKRHGQWVTFSEKGNVLFKLNYKNDMLDGVLNEFNEAGVPVSEIFYKNDIIDGTFKQYYPDGNPKEISMYSKGKKDGTENLFYSNGKRMSVGEYKNGSKTGLWKYYYNSGKRKSEGHYKNGKKTGKWRIYDENEKLANTEDF